MQHTYDHHNDNKPQERFNLIKNFYRGWDWDINSIVSLGGAYHRHTCSGSKFSNWTSGPEQYRSHGSIRSISRHLR